VPLTDLFPNPPSGDPFTEYTLKTDDTWGTGLQQGSDNEPNDAAFAFVVMTSPEALQISLDKRDGASWEVFNCNDAESEEEQTIQIFCTDISLNSTCKKIHLGHGVPGTILEMPPGCGPSRYAVAKSMVPAADQTLPKHLEKRDYGHKPVVYDLTFDFEWQRVPRDLGDTQVRVDYSNEVVSLSSTFHILLPYTNPIGILGPNRRQSRRVETEEEPSECWWEPQTLA